MRIRAFGIILFFFLSNFFAGKSAPNGKNRSPLVWDYAELKQMKDNIAGNKSAIVILKDADKYCEQDPVVITNKRLTIEPSIHYLFSMGPYRWADPSNPGKYIIKDGLVNPASHYYDNVKMRDMVVRCRDLGKAFFLTNNEKYFNAYVAQLNAWFLNKDTFMLPNFEYSQVDPNQIKSGGNSTGMIDAYSFNSLIESIRLVNGVKTIDRKTMQGLKKWFLAFANWAEEAHGQYFQSVDNNISLAFDVTMVNMYMFVGKERKAKKIVSTFSERRINKQINEDGKQPQELKRTLAFSYSVYNLTHIIDFCFLVRNLDKEFYYKNNKRIDAAFSYLQQFTNKPESFPYQQISGWGDGLKMLCDLSVRYNKLKQ